MMICPQTKAECKRHFTECNEWGRCFDKPATPDMAAPQSGMAWSMENLSGTRLDAKMAEIELLLEAYYAARYEHEHGAGAYLQTTDYADAEAALMAAIRSLSNSAQNGE